MTVNLSFLRLQYISSE